MTEWMFRGITHRPGESFPDGTDPAALKKRWEPFIQDCLLLLDGDGTFRHWKYKGAYADQPWLDICIYRVIRGRWVELKNREMQGKWNNVNGLKGGHKPRRRPAFSGRRR